MINNISYKNKYSLKAWLSLFLICIIWGTTYLFLKLGVNEMAPFLFSAIRQSIAGIILGVCVISIFKVKLPSKKIIINNFIAGIAMITFGNGLVAYSEVVIPSSMAAIICASMPVWIAVINIFRPSQFIPSKLGYFAVLLGIGGILGLFSDALIYFKDRAYLIGAFLTLIATFAWIIGTFIIKKNPKNENPFILASIQMISGGIGLFIFSFCMNEPLSVQMTSQGLFALIYLIILGSIVAMVSYTIVLKEMPVQLVSIYAYVNPMVALFLGWILLDETLTLSSAISCLVIILGVVLINLPSAKREKI